MTRDPVIGAIAAAIAPPDAGAARTARAVFHGREDGDDMERLAARLAGARHSDRPALKHLHVVICAGDHGAVMALSPNPAVLAVKQVASGEAAINGLARTAGATVSVVDCGLRDQPAEATVMDLRVGPGTADVRQGPAMSRTHAVTSVQTGIALTLSLADTGADCIALGQIAPHSQAVSAALITALCQGDLDLAGDEVGSDVSAALAANPVQDKPVMDILAALGGYELGVMAGIILAAASLRIPVVLDDQGTSAAALVAAGLAPDVAGYLIASQAGTTPAHMRALRELELTSLFDLGLAHGEGTGAALALPILESVARVLCVRPSS